MKCSQCGNDNTSDAQFCIGCGTSLSASTANGMKDQLRDKARDGLTYALNSVGVKAEMAERGRAEEKVENSWHQRSQGVIDILEGSIRWINILKKDGSNNSPPRWWVVLGIPDERPVSIRQQTKIKTVWKRTFPLFGKVIDVIWKGYDGGTGLVNTLARTYLLRH